jgi:hypothetical protein
VVKLEQAGRLLELALVLLVKEIMVDPMRNRRLIMVLGVEVVVERLVVMVVAVPAEVVALVQLLPLQAQVFTMLVVVVALL